MYGQYDNPLKRDEKVADVLNDLIEVIDREYKNGDEELDVEYEFQQFLRVSKVAPVLFMRSMEEYWNKHKQDFKSYTPNEIPYRFTETLMLILTDEADQTTTRPITNTQLKNIVTMFTTYKKAHIENYRFHDTVHDFFRNSPASQYFGERYKTAIINAIASIENVKVQTGGYHNRRKSKKSSRRVFKSKKSKKRTRSTKSRRH